LRAGEVHLKDIASIVVRDSIKNIEMKKRFILLIDLTEQSKALLRIANTWAMEVGAELLVVNQVFSVAPGMGEGEIRNEIKQQERRTALTQLTDFTRETLGDDTAPVKFYVTTGSLELAIHKLHLSEMSDFIWVGMKSKNWLERIFMQSTAIRITADVKKTIIALPDGYKGTDFDHLYVAVSPKYPLNEDAFRKLLSIATSIGKKVTVFSVLKSNEPDEEVKSYLKSLGDLYSQTQAISSETVRNDDALSGIRAYMEQKEGILVVQKGTRTLADFFRKYVVDDLLHLSEIPLVILP
jgi:hypothetical protein